MTLYKSHSPDTRCPSCERVQWDKGEGPVVRRCWVYIPVPGRPTNLDDSRQGLIAIAGSAGGGCLDIFLSSITYFFLPLSGRRQDIDGNTVSKGR